MSQQVATQTHQQPKTTPAPISGVLQRKCACGQHTVAGGECTECRKKRMSLQRKATNQAEPTTAPRIVHEVLRSPGQPLDAATRAFMESRFGYDFSRVRTHTATPQLAQAGLPVGPVNDRFEQEADRVAETVVRTPGPGASNTAASCMGYDFSQVRVHMDAKAIQSAQAVNARAYTVGHHVVFGAGQYRPQTPGGRQLLAHELAHTVQQGGITPGTSPASTTSLVQRAENDEAPNAEPVVQECRPLPAPNGEWATEPWLCEMRLDEFKYTNQRLLALAPTGPARGRSVALVHDVLLAWQCAFPDAVNHGLPVSEFEAAEYREGTTRVVKDFQRWAKITVDGIVGPITIQKLDAFVGGPTFTPQECRPEAPPPPRPPTTKPKTPPGSTPTTEDCSLSQTTMLTKHLDSARIWVNDAERKVAAYAYVFASPRHSAVPRSPAETRIVRAALVDNFHTTSAGHVRTIAENFASLKTALNDALDFECVSSFWCGDKELAYVRGRFAWVRRLGDVNVCPFWFRCGNYLIRTSTIVHEVAHQHPGAEDPAYEWQSAYATLTPAQAIDNADSYAVASRQIYHGGRHGPGERC